MKHFRTFAIRIKHRILPIGCAAALAVALTASAQQAQAGHVTPPPMPDEIKVQGDDKAYLEGHAVGTQNYVCLPSGSGFAWSLFTPEATLFNDHDRQVITHFFSPDSHGTVRATWLHSRDSSTFWGALIAPSSDARFVAQGAIPWLLLGRGDVLDGPTGGDTLSVATFVQRVNTLGGVAPPTGCSVATDVGKRAFVPYEADYIFYRAPHGDDDLDDDGN
jgi:Protein of unknown function (DUF3455)